MPCEGGVKIYDLIWLNEKKNCELIRRFGTAADQLKILSRNGSNFLWNHNKFDGLSMIINIKESNAPKPSLEGPFCNKTRIPTPTNSYEILIEKGKKSYLFRENVYLFLGRVRKYGLLLRGGMPGRNGTLWSQCRRWNVVDSPIDRLFKIIGSWEVRFKESISQRFYI